MQTLKAEDAVYGGYVISRDEGVIFIKGAIPGEVVEIAISDKKRDYSIASVINVIEPSIDRIEPRCMYFGECGGCHLQFASYEQQVKMKARVLQDCMYRIAGMEIEQLPPLTGRDFNYRHRAQFKVSRDGMIGFYAEGTRQVVPVHECPLMTTEINDVLRRMKSMELTGLREVHVTHGDSLVVRLTGRGFDEALAEDFIEAGFTGVAFDDGSSIGKDYVEMDLNGLSYTVSPWSFFQSNWDLNKEVLTLISETIKPIEIKRVLDMYAGAGNFSLPLAFGNTDVVAVEENPYSIQDGERNILMNKTNKFIFSKGSAETAKIRGSFDTVILDPPRPGLTRAAMERVMETDPERIIYISCNPSTFARDIKRLAEAYETDSVRMIDMFPNTYHVECLAFLVRKKSQVA
jgi:23S rRNA (uracil1939-C5)-methyltransferase